MANQKKIKRLRDKKQGFQSILGKIDNEIDKLRLRKEGLKSQIDEINLEITEEQAK